MLFRKVKPREGFIGICILMMGVDDFVDPRELSTCMEVLARYGFSDAEIKKTANRLKKFSPKNAVEWSGKALESITKLDPEMQKNLVKAMQEIAEADEKIEDIEDTLLSSVKSILSS